MKECRKELVEFESMRETLDRWIDIVKEARTDNNSREAKKNTIRAALKEAKKLLSTARKDIFLLKLAVYTTAEVQAKRDEDEKKRFHELAFEEIKARQDEAKSTARQVST